MFGLSRSIWGTAHAGGSVYMVPPAGESVSTPRRPAHRITVTFLARRPKGFASTCDAMKNVYFPSPDVASNVLAEQVLRCICRNLIDNRRANLGSSSMIRTQALSSPGFAACSPESKWLSSKPAAFMGWNFMVLDSSVTCMALARASSSLSSGTSLSSSRTRGGTGMPLVGPLQPPQQS